MKKILIIRPKVGFELGGAERHVAEVAIRLLQRGFQISLIAHEVSLSKEIVDQIDLYRLPLRGFGSIPKQLLFIFQAKRILQEIHYDYLISFYRFPWKSNLFILCDPLVSYTLHQRGSFLSLMRPRYRIMLKLEKVALTEAKKVIALFSPTRNILANFYPQILSKTYVCHRGIDIQKFHPHLRQNRNIYRKIFNLSPKDYIILFVGYDTKRKGLNLLLKTLPHLPSHIKLLVAGKDGTSSERVKFLGKVKEMEKLYALADLFVLPTLYDPGAQSTLEALASGTPVITTPFDGTSEFVIEGLNGFVVEREEKALKEAILRALDTPFDPYIIASTVAHLTWDNYVDCLINHLKE